MTELAVIGSETFGMGFRLAGIRRIFVADDERGLASAVTTVMRTPEVSILVMETKDVGRLDGRLRQQLVGSVRPTLVAVGAEEDNTLRDKIKQAVGVDLW